jgi:hypothetical protein
MSDRAKDAALARGEAKSKIQWGADVQEVLDLLRTKYDIVGEEADAIIAEALEARKGQVRHKALIGLVFSLVGLAIPVAYFAIQGFVGFVRVGMGSVLMALFGLVCLLTTARNLARLLTGESTGPV